MTDVRDDLRAALADRSGSVALSPEFTDRVRGAVTRHERHRRFGSLALAASVVILVLGAATLALRASGDDAPTHVVAGPGESVTTGTWVPMPDGPLSPRDSALSFTVGDEVLIFGGRPEPGCPPGPGFSCRLPEQPPLTDGAAYNPSTRTWRPIADTLAPIYSASGAVIGDRLYLWAEVECPPNTYCATPHGEFLAYDVGDDEWTRPSYPLRPGDVLRLAAVGDRIIGYHNQAGGDLADLVYTPATDTWTPLPVDPLQPGLDRVVVGHDDDLYLFSVPTEATRPSGDSASYYQAALLEAGSDRWRVLPESRVERMSATWVPIGDLIVNPTPRGDWVTRNPGGVLDTDTDTWGPLPQPLTPIGTFYELGGVIAGDRYLTSFGFVLDALAGTWTSLPHPDGIAEYGFTAAWADDTLIVWGGTADGEPTDAGATWTVGEPSEDASAPATNEDAAATSGVLTPEMDAALATGAPVALDDAGDAYCTQHPDGAGYACGRLDESDPSISMRWNYQEGNGSIVVVDGQRRLDRLEVVGADGGVLRTVEAEEGGLYLKASATQIPDMIRIVGRHGAVLRTLHPTAMAADNLETAAQSGIASD